MSRRAHAYVFAALAVALVGLHFDRWNDHRVEPWALGWMPADLAYHVGWVIAATALIFYLCARVWPDAGAAARRDSDSDRDRDCGSAMERDLGHRG